MLQYKVPQNIDLADKIFGPLTLFQFLYLLAGGMVFYVFFKAEQMLLAIFIGGPAVLIALACAFVKINDQPFSRFIFSFIRYLINPKILIWRKSSQENAPQIIRNATTTQTKKVVKKISLEDIRAMAEKLDNKI
ncbi:MAG: Uncharacterized protein CEN91_117 [Candidatus Berkelbacteria bacterium Licking1014_85]|uniref:PrgI family protein n=1 Tax=Candidatus Berkelbacteria bacterium Licking1014_85 TaxID=2017148 RepID=A0A554LLL1_9BACT|nr:MAG: Uncharacterized protein CEN91_117 [Candidatus Berkelbacteria bacterium Licking1014_85]